VFGGLYSEPFSTDGPQPVPSDISKNLFEMLGQAIGYLETNSQTGIQETLALCRSVDEHIGQVRTTIGSRMNRVEAVASQLQALQIDESDRLSSLEDVDVSELMIRLAQQQVAYPSVLQSTSMIMQISLLNYL
jgi:flagellar hook-associated protein 3 FlgL